MSKIKQIQVKGGFKIFLDEKFNLTATDKNGKKVPKTKLQNIINFHMLKKISNSLRG